MTRHTIVAAAGNTLAPALAILLEIGFAVTRGSDGSSYRAQDNGHLFIADDPLTLLGLVKLYEMRGENWQPSDTDITAFLSLDAV